MKEKPKYKRYEVEQCESCDKHCPVEFMTYHDDISLCSECVSHFKNEFIENLEKKLKAARKRIKKLKSLIIK